MEMKPYIVYVKTNPEGYISAVNSNAFLEDVTGWAEIDSGYGDKYHHAQGNYFPKPIMTMGGAYCYKLIDGKVVECTAEEIKAQETADAAKPLTVEERLSALERTVKAAEYAPGTWYHRGDKVCFGETVYTCIAPEGIVCVWSPTEYPAYWVS